MLLRRQSLVAQDHDARFGDSAAYMVKGGVINGGNVEIVKFNADMRRQRAALHHFSPIAAA